MKRKINLVGQNTLTVSLPTKWVNKHNIKKGQEIEVEEEGDKLVLRVKEFSKERTIFADLTPITTTSLLNSAIIRLMMLDYKIIKLKFQKEINTTPLYEKKVLKTQDAIRDLISQQVGMEIIDEKPDSCIIKEVSDINSMSYKDTIRRGLLLLLEYSEFVHENLHRKKLTNEELRQIYLKKMYYFDKYLKFAIKILTHSDMTDSEKQRWIAMITNYQAIAYTYCTIGIVANRDCVEDKILAETNSLLRKYYNQTFDPKIKEIDLVAQDINQLQSQLLFEKDGRNATILPIITIMKQGILNLPFDKVIKITE